MAGRRKFSRGRKKGPFSGGWRRKDFARGMKPKPVFDFEEIANKAIEYLRSEGYDEETYDNPMEYFGKILEGFFGPKKKKYEDD